MAELTTLEAKLGEVVGLAMAAQGATQKVKGMLDGGELAQTLQRMHDEAAEAEERGTEVAGTFDGKKTAILEKAREVKQEATEMMQTYLGGESDALDGFEFLTMAEAGEVGHVAILETLNQRAGNAEVEEYVAWVKPIQERHFRDTMDGSLRLAREEDPESPA